MLTEWRAISARIRALRETGQMYAHFSASVQDGLGGAKALNGQATLLYTEIKKFSERFATVIPPQARDTLRQFITQRESIFQGSTIDVRQVLLATQSFLGALDSEVTFLLSDVQETIKRLSERALAHLQRSIVADPDVRAKWVRAFEEGETACEQLGALHLLQHGIWAFKANAEGARTDLILGEPVTDTDAERVSDGLVLTEWKRAKTPKEAEKLFDGAKRQAAKYVSGMLSGIELLNYRYLVVVTQKPLANLSDIAEGDTVYRRVNIAIEVPTPSRDKT